MKIKFTWRYTVVGYVFFMLGVLIIGQLFRIQLFVDETKLYDPHAIGQREKSASRRGLIVDRRGKILAGNQTVYTVTMDLQAWKNAALEGRDGIVEEDIGYVLDSAIDVFDIQNEHKLELLSVRPYPPDPNLKALELDVSASPEEVERFLSYVSIIQHQVIEEINPDSEEADKNPHAVLVDCDRALGITCEPHFGRIYPEGEIASNILGFVKIGEGTGLLGLEGKYDTTLKGDSREFFVSWDPHKADQANFPEHGASLILTIDSILQHEVEKILDRAVKENGSQAGTIIVMNPENGDIYAMASSPRINGNFYWQDEHQELVTNIDNVFNYGIKVYEPGSVFKVLTMAAALDADVVEPDTEFLDTGSRTVQGVTIQNWNKGAWGPQTMTTCMQHSLNVCLASVALDDLGPEQFYDYMEAFGFGQYTGIGLAGEPSGVLKTNDLANGWDISVLATNSFGQGIEVTPVQMLKAISALANDGKMVVPRLVKAVIDDGYQYEAPDPTVGQPISAETARTLTGMLANSLEKESSSALVSGYQLAGKTGTAEIYVKEQKGYTSNLTNASFVGWGPVDDPQFVVYVWFHKPTSAIWGSVVASPVFHDVVEKVVTHMDIPPDDIRLSLKEDT
jgi:cell division protein FtsI/penicillin-binding protein 2